MTSTTRTLRQHERIRTRLRVFYGMGTPEFEATAESISVGGVFLNTNNVLKVGSRLVVQIDFPDRSVCLCGEVTWAIRVPEHQRETMVCGMGVTFIDPDPSWRTFFESWRAGGRP